MLRVLTALLLCAAAEAATLNVNLAVNATLTSSGTTYTASGTATLTGGIADTGTFSSNIDLTTVTTTGAPYTLTLKNGTLGGIIIIPESAFVALLGGGTSASGISATVTSASGNYAGYSGSFPNLSGSGSLGATGAISFTFSGAGTLTTGGTITNPPPTITAVQNDASNAYGTPNTVGQGSLVVVKGTNMSASGYNKMSLPYPTSTGSGGTSVTFTPAAGGTGTQIYVFYTYNENGVNQIGGIVPSTLATGNYSVTVAYNGSTSNAVTVKVVGSNPGIFTQDESGAGLAVVENYISATQYDIDRLTTFASAGYTFSPSKAGQLIIIWVTGLGAVPYADNIVPPQAYNFSGVQVIIGGTSITPVYAGASGYPGLFQINVTLPANIPTGCTVVLQISVGGVTSPATTMSIADTPSASTCTLTGYTSSLLSSLDNGATINSGGFQLSQTTFSIPGTGTITEASVGGGFTQLTGLELPSVATGGSGSVSTTTIGNCTVFQSTFTGNNVTQTPSAGGVSTPLDGGAVTMSGPAVSNLNNTALSDPLNPVTGLPSGVYSFTIGETGLGIPGEPTGTLGAGAYPLNAAGGTGVTSFNTSITLGAPLTITGGLPTAVVRSAGLPLTWTGGNPTDEVTIEGYSGTVTGTSPNQTTTATVFICKTTAGTGGDTISSQVLNLLPATAATTAGGTGVLIVSSGPSPVSFTTTLTSSPSTQVQASYSASVGTLGTVTYQ
jgi:uncharacterized protein (TIGR03437 family)